ncbi:MAG TPA: VanZ family protein [Limnochordia bacterium]
MGKTIARGGRLEIRRRMGAWFWPALFAAAVLGLGGEPEAAAPTWAAFLRHLFPGWSEATLHTAVFALRKAGHVLAYAVMMCLCARGTRLSSGRVRWVLAAGLTAALAVADELNQLRFAARTGSALDVGIDMVGALCGGAWYARLRGGRFRRI